MSEKNTRKTVDISGTVQGVGFRPGVHRLATELGLGGWVQNRSGVVRVVLEGEKGAVDEFLKRFSDAPPPQAVIEGIELVKETEIKEQAPTFHIRPSIETDAFRVSFPPDLAMCAACLSEISDPNDRRYGYPFTTCTDCGPRYTVINEMPYDRERTTLSEFPLCERCASEYNDPTGRRFHAESIACPECGPTLSFLDSKGSEVTGNPLLLAREILAQGHILAVRGIGGYLLAVDATNQEAVTKLRERKTRPHKPLAVMAPNLEVLEQYCEIPETARNLLSSPEAPIVILDLKKNGDAHQFPHCFGGIENISRKLVSVPVFLDLLSPDTATLGCMLPTSPLHWLLFHPLDDDPTPAFSLLVMTSGNQRAEPICIKNQEALERLSGIADYFLIHDREINLRADDSLCRVQLDQPQLWRRGRGHTPNRVQLKHALGRCVLAMGAELKNTIAVGEGNEIVMSPHVGDLETPEALAAHGSVVDCLPGFLKKAPEVVAVDLHPDMHSTVLGRKLAKEAGIELSPVQHHYAHAASCMAEHGKTECLALVFDGTGYGPDGAIWGAELLHATLDGFQRLATFVPAPLPGGDASVREPIRQVVGRFVAAGQEVPQSVLGHYRVLPEELRVWRLQTEKSINSPLSHAAGRVFDSFSVLLGISPRRTTYDGQAAIRLEAQARAFAGESPEVLDFSLRMQSGILVVDWQNAFSKLACPKLVNGREAEWALSAHNAVSAAALEMVRHGLSRVSTRTVALSGGVFMNSILTGLVVAGLRDFGVEILIHREVPPNDGGISVGQAYVSGRRERCA